LNDSIRFCPRCGQTLTEQVYSGKLRKVCAACHYIHFADPKVAVVVFMEQGGKILLGKRGVDPERGKWSLPGGFVDYGEDPAKAAAREVAEETGLTAQITHLIDVMFAASSSAIVICYAGRVLSGTLRAADDVEEVGWFAPNDLPEIAFESTARLINQWKDALTKGEKTIGYPFAGH
jgi:ADP-ribose pyrophosphatase YjhB (NUDIX family)